MLLDSPDLTNQTSPEDIIDAPRPRVPLRPLYYPPPHRSPYLLSAARRANEVQPFQDLAGYISSSQSERIPSRFHHLELCRQAHARKRNFIQSSIHKLSPDILGTIFEYVCLSRPKQAWQRPFCPTVLGLICVYWHDVAWCTPRLWTRIKLNYSFWRAGGRNRLVKLYVQNSGGMGLHVDICNAPLVDGRGGSLGIPGGDVFDTLFVKNPHKLESLEFRVYVSSWVHHIGEISSLGCLKNLMRMKIKDSRDLVPVLGTSLFIPNTGAFRELTLDGLAGPFTCPWTQLAHLTLAVIPSDDAFAAIQSCTNLESLRCIHLIHQDIWQPDVIPSSFITFPYLKSIVWESTVPLSPSWNEALTHWFKFSSLQNFKFKMPITVVKQPSSLLLNLPKSVTSLSLQIDLRNIKEARTCIAKNLRNVKAANIDILRRVLSSSPSLSTLTLECDPFFDPEIIHMLALQATQTDLVPGLRELVVVTESSWTPEAFSAYLRVVRSRWSENRSEATKHIRAIGFVVQTAIWVEQWPVDFIVGMREMIQQGLKVAVYVKKEGRVDIDWFAPYRAYEGDMQSESMSSSYSVH